MSLVSNEYAKALFEVAIENTKQNEYEKQLEVIKEVFSDNTDYLKIFKTPDIKQDDKKNLLAKALINVDKYILHFLFVLLDNDRIDNFDEIVKDYSMLLSEYKKEIVVDVTTAVNLTDEQIKKLASNLEKKFLKKVVIKNHIDKKIIGGMKISKGNDIIDLSVSKKLKSLEKKIVVG